MPTKLRPTLRRHRLGQPTDRDRARVRGEDRGRRRNAVELAPQRGLDGDVLEDRLDDEVRLGNSSPIVRGDDAPEGRVALGVRQLALGDGPLEVAGDPVATRGRAREIRLVERDLLADSRVDLGDAVAHQAGAGDEDPLDRHPSSVAAPAVNGRASDWRRAASSSAPNPTTAADARNAPS